MVKSSIVIRDPDTGRSLPADLTGKRSHHLTALAPTGERDNNGYSLWKIQCDCGNVIVRPSYIIVRGTQRTCGCGPKGRPRIEDSGAFINAIYTHTKRSASTRKYDFTLTKEQLQTIIIQTCFYCGAPPKERSMKNLAGKFAFNGIDRVDNKQGYIFENCVPCCATCNRAKSTLAIDEFKNWIDRAYNHLHS